MEVIFESPAIDDSGSRVSWLYTESEESTLVETNVDHLFDSHEPEPFKHDISAY
ncbi:MAG: hypothetical protein ABI333_24060 [bacterium]